MNKIEKKVVTVIGLGYIGLPTAALLASKGHTVLGMDVNRSAVDTINRGEIHIVEPDLDTYVSSAVAKGLLRAHTSVQPADVYMLCVPTPFHSDGEIPTPNTDYVLQAAKSAAPHIKDNDIVILESTSPVGTTQLVLEVLRDEGVDTTKISVAYCPERVLPGDIMRELIENDRVIGGVNEQSTRAVVDFYRSFVTGEILETNDVTAEMCKLTENSFRDVNIAFANELSMICGDNGINVSDLIKLANHHPRVNILNPGTGVGGHCIAVDPWFIVSSDPVNSKIIKQARLVNDTKPKWVVEKIITEANNLALNSVRILCLGLSFKPNIDDLRESPAVEVVDSLKAKGFSVACVEPNIGASENYELVDLSIDLSEYDIVAILVGHKEFITEESQLRLIDKGALDFCGALNMD
jgi:UDP-N-acetyl-D-mannosaminuronic acid dehydrogenase